MCSRIAHPRSESVWWPACRVSLPLGWRVRHQSRRPSSACASESYFVRVRRGPCSPGFCPQPRRFSARCSRAATTRSCSSARHTSSRGSAPTRLCRRLFAGSPPTSAPSTETRGSSGPAKSRGTSTKACSTWRRRFASRRSCRRKRSSLSPSSRTPSVARSCASLHACRLARPLVSTPATLRSILARCPHLRAGQRSPQSSGCQSSWCTRRSMSRLEAAARSCSLSSHAPPAPTSLSTSRRAALMATAARRRLHPKAARARCQRCGAPTSLCRFAANR
mmetsp:Transcript_24567/g.81699  ORF Transcript_24567/g.81699 Transcript_24567/m.81699 type:complete len:278 (-) Transcript_24567:2685-3518(-)